MNSNTSFLVSMWAIIFKWIEKISIFHFIRWIFPSLRRSYWFVDAWVLFNLVFSVVSVFILAYGDISKIYSYLLVFYGLFRVLEIFVYQVNVLLFHPLQNQASYSIHSHRRMIIALVHNFFEIIFWFAVSYLAFNINFGNEFANLNPFSVIYFSMLTMVSYTSTIAAEGWSLTAILILHFQAIVGVFMTLISLSRFISLFPKPKEMDAFQEEEILLKKVELLEKQVNKLIRLTQSQRRR
ncbi:hypothetical protein QOZ98_001345 [Planomicrobium stackebrandtii]|uniref:Potassium channel domain-containing protein n=1 Tax=Planomicrobium stackebrandtii TaxID=253160 RepID=A0ABU0GT32_9BACL|nr:hypothetical protein [Planomicrobium stackebrandtii]MDQ0428519.1 hypothetical protein [Planomicrobium stackebrandtii]